MIQTIYETHLQVKDLERSIQFYQTLGLPLAHKIEARRCAFFYVGQHRQMLGLWEVPKDQEVKRSHFAFGVELDDLMNANAWLQSKGIEPVGSFGKEPIEPLVHTWMPAASVYFHDPDGNSLELISWLEGEPMVLDYVPYLSEWNKLKSKNIKD
jgi:lactoylglutathione lyase